MTIEDKILEELRSLRVEVSQLKSQMEADRRYNYKEIENLKKLINPNVPKYYGEDYENQCAY